MVGEVKVNVGIRTMCDKCGEVPRIDIYAQKIYDCLKAGHSVSIQMKVGSGEWEDVALVLWKV